MELSNRDKFILARWSYSVGKPIYSDSEYTIMLDYMKQRYPNDKYTNRSWSSDPCPAELLKTIGREDLIAEIILSDKTESIPSINSEADIQRELADFCGEGTLSMKHDGWHIQANYYNGDLVSMNTRGRVKDSIDVEVLSSSIPKTIPIKDKVKISMEATVSNSVFDFCKSQFNNSNERGAVSTLLSQPQYAHLISLHAFDIFGINLEGKCKFTLLSDLGFNVPKFFRVSNFTEIIDALRYLSEQKTTYGFPTDGAVFDGHKRRAIRLGAWEEPIYYSYVTGYLEQYSLYRISPSILIKPVLRNGTTQRRLNITNWQRILDHDLRPGSPIAFRVASSAIADYDEESTKLIREAYSGRWEEFKEKVDTDEEVKRIQWQHTSFLSQQ